MLFISGILFVSLGPFYLKISEDGTSLVGDYLVFDPTAFYPAGYRITIVFRGQRTEKALDLPAPSG